MQLIVMAGVWRNLDQQTLAEFQQPVNQFFQQHDYQLIWRQSHADVLQILEDSAVIAMIIDATFALEPFNHRPFIEYISTTLPIVAIGNSRQIGYDWIQVFSGKHREYAHSPADVEELLAKIQKVIKE